MECNCGAVAAFREVGLAYLEWCGSRHDRNWMSILTYGAPALAAWVVIAVQVTDT